MVAAGGREASMAKITPEQKLRNVARILKAHTEVKRHYNGRGRPATYASDIDAIATTGRHLADMVERYLDGELTESDDKELF
jgi:hypothetical protein